MPLLRSNWQQQSQLACWISTSTGRRSTHCWHQMTGNGWVTFKAAQSSQISNGSSSHLQIWLLILSLLVSTPYLCNMPFTMICILRIRGIFMLGSSYICHPQSLWCFSVNLPNNWAMNNNKACWLHWLMARLRRLLDWLIARLQSLLHSMISIIRSCWHAALCTIEYSFGGEKMEWPLLIAEGMFILLLSSLTGG